VLLLFLLNTCLLLSCWRCSWCCPLQVESMYKEFAGKVVMDLGCGTVRDRRRGASVKSPAPLHSGKETAAAVQACKQKPPLGQECHDPWA
jgi:hypothetical protein